MIATKWVLFIFLYASGNPVAADHVYFPDKHSCESAALAVFNASNATTFCEPETASDK